MLDWVNLTRGEGNKNGKDDNNTLCFLFCETTTKNFSKNSVFLLIGIEGFSCIFKIPYLKKNQREFLSKGSVYSKMNISGNLTHRVTSSSYLLDKPVICYNLLLGEKGGTISIFSYM